jgi:GNAT superfamily N-acetyltransferase
MFAVLPLHAQVRAQGVGQALIEAVYKLADERGAPKVYWQTHEQNYRWGCQWHNSLQVM